MAEDNHDHEVGYRRPPKSTRFKKGQSGNPKGRPRRPKAGDVDVAGILDEHLPVKTGGKVTAMSSLEASLRSLVRRAINKGDVNAAMAFLKMCEDYGIMAPAIQTAARGVYVVPNEWDFDEWLEMFERHGPPPWPGDRSGLPRSLS